MRLPPGLVPALFVRRVNRFLALVEVAGAPAQAHVANSGRLEELFQPGRPVWLAGRPGQHRKTAYDLQLVALPTGLVSADARLPNALVAEAFAQGRLEPFRHYPSAQREVPHGSSRLDLVLTRPQGRCSIEVKSVTLVAEGRGLFPDAPTERGRRHLRALAEARRHGDRAAVIFVIQRADAVAFAPHDRADAAFGQGLREAAAAGVEVYAYRCSVTREEVLLDSSVPVVL